MNDTLQLWPHLEYNGAVTWFAKGHPGQKMGGILRSAPQLEKAMANMNRRGLDFYVGVNGGWPTGIRASRADIKLWRYIVLDIDPVEDNSEPSNASRRAMVTAADMLSLPSLRQYCTIIDSGRGYQVWISVQPQLLSDSPAMLKAEQLMAGFIQNLSRAVGISYGCRIDTSCSDLARVARMPGGINQKTGRYASAVSTAVQSIDPLLLAPYVATWGIPVNADQLPWGEVALEHYLKLHKIMPFMKERAGQFLTQGVESPGRHAAAYAAAANLRELRIPQWLAETWVGLGGQMCVRWNGSNIVLYPLEPDDCVRIVRNAYSKILETGVSNGPA